MTTPALIDTEIAAIEPIARDIKLFTLRAVTGALPGFASGSHIVLQLNDGGQRRANAYSLLDPAAAPDCYRIAVKLDGASRGGSRLLHERVAVGDRLQIAAPANLFALAPAGPHLFIAGGIGITPFVAHMAALKAADQPYTLHYAFRGAATAAFVDPLRGDAQARLYDSARGERMALEVILAQATAATQVYVCGPQRLIDAVSAACAGRIAPGQLHVERFAAAAPAAAGGFTVRLARSGGALEVGAGESILAALERAGIAVESMCREGYCGSCETALLAGEAEHCDQYLDAAEQAAQRKIMLCVSRARSAELLLDL